MVGLVGGGFLTARVSADIQLRSNELTVVTEGGGSKEDRLYSALQSL